MPRNIATESPDGEADHFRRLARLLEMEGASEAQQAARRNRRLSPAEAERSGNTLLKLSIVDEDAGLGGRYLVHLARGKNAPLPWTRLRVGSPVMLCADSSSARSNSADAGYRGVVCERDERSLTVALSELPGGLGDHDLWRLDISYDEVATRRQRTAIDRVGKARADRLAQLRDILLGNRQPCFATDPVDPPLDAALNESQCEAVLFALSARDVALIHGPPGTGKTTTLVELIRRSVRRGEKVLVCAPSNMAVDNLFQRLVGFEERAVRLGHPARVSAELRGHTLDLLVEKHADVRLARKFVKQAMALFREADRFTRAKPKPGSRRQLRQDGRSLLADARRLETQAVEQVLDRADILCATTTGLDDRVLGDRRFDLAVIDEACQSTEPGCWIPLLRAQRLVLAGDHCQLPPTVVSREAAAEGFSVSLFERLMTLYDTKVSHRLDVQYRMNRAIMDFSSEEFYDGNLEAAPSACDRLLSDLPEVTTDRLTQTPVEFIDTAGAEFDEEVEPDGESRRNPREAMLVCRKVHALLQCGVAAQDIAVIAPYAAQVRLIRERLELADVEVDSVDGFQGREKEAVVISLVRSSTTREIGFLADVRRMNVALTRAKRKLVVVGDSATLSVHPFYRRLFEYFERIDAYRSVWEEDGHI